jgi:hypothetical protein
MHKSRLGAVIVDCETDDLEREAEFWGAALGGEVTSPRPGGRYLDVQGDPADPRVILQRVEHPSRIHIDIETDDIDAEVKRLQDLARISHHPSRQLLLHCSTSGTPDRCIPAVVLWRRNGAPCLTFTRSERST